MKKIINPLIFGLLLSASNVYATDHDMSHDMAESMPHDMVENMSHDMAENMSHDMAENMSHDMTQKMAVMAATPACDVSPGCPLAQWSEELTLTLPQALYAERLLDFSLDFNQPVTKVTAQLAGVSMYMGKIPVIFKQQAQVTRFKAKALVARCGSHMMTWRLTISWQQAGKTHYGYRDLVVANPS